MSLVAALGSALADFGVRWAHRPGAAVHLIECYGHDDWLAARDLGAIDAAHVDEHGRQHQVRIAATRVADELARGRTICADVSHAAGVRPLLAELAAWVPGGIEPPFAKLYVSPPGAGFAMHMDAHHVFVIQLRGRKRWRVSEPAVIAPLVGGKLDDGRAVHTWPRDGEPIVDEAGEPIAAPHELHTVELAPGDLLYVPPGAWHATEAIEDTMAISLSPPRAPALRLVMAVLEQELARRARWRRDLFRGPAGAGAVPGSIADALDGCARELAAIVGELDGTLLRRAWAMSALPPRVEPRPAAAGELRPGSMLVHTDPRGFFTIEGAEVLHVVFAGGELELPLDARGFLAELAGRPRLRADEVLRWDPRLAWDGARDLLAGLVEVGLLRIE